MGGDPRLVLSRISGPLYIPDEMEKSAIQTELILLLPRGIFKTMREKAKYEIGETYPAGRQYFFPGTTAGRVGGSGHIRAAKSCRV